MLKVNNFMNVSEQQVSALIEQLMMNIEYVLLKNEHFLVFNKCEVHTYEKANAC